MANEQDAIETPLRYCVLCSDVASSMTTREPILYRLIVAIRARQLPVQHPLAVVTHWVLDGPAAHRVCVSVLLPESPESNNRETLVWSEGEMEILHPDTHYIHTFQFGELEFPVAGLYRVEVYLDGTLAGAFPLLVRQVGQAQADEGGDGADEQPQEQGATDEQA
jgi:hypothetical protein